MTPTKGSYTLQIEYDNQQGGITIINIVSFKEAMSHFRQYAGLRPARVNGFKIFKVL